MRTGKMPFKKKRTYRLPAGTHKVMWFSITAGLMCLVTLLMVLRSFGRGDSAASEQGAVRLAENPHERAKGLAQELVALDQQRKQRQSAGQGSSSDHEAAQDKFASTRKELRRGGALTSVTPHDVAEKGAGVDGAADQRVAADQQDAARDGQPGQGTAATSVDVDNVANGRLAVEDSESAEGGDASERKCHVEEHAEFAAPTVVVWGSNNIMASGDACCAACMALEECNVWVFCESEDGCPGDHVQGECWLKHTDTLRVAQPDGVRAPESPWTSGAVYSRKEALAAAAAQEAAETAERERRSALRADASRPLVWLDVAIKGQSIGRMEFVLFTREAPRAAENFRALCTCEKGHAPDGHEGAGKAYCLKANVQDFDRIAVALPDVTLTWRTATASTLIATLQGAYFYRIIDRFINQSGAGTDSVFGGFFKDDPGGLALKHDRAGLLSMANQGPDTNGSHFSIVVAPAPHLNGKYTIFGELVSGWHVAERINALARGKPDNTAGESEGAQITDSGQLHRS